MSTIHRLDQACTVHDGGGKWLGLTTLSRLGAPVPPALCIGTQVFRELLDSQSITPLIEELDRASTQALPALAARIRARIAEPALPPELSQEILASFEALGSVPVAVRSSATAEDRADASFAGQYDTVLDVRSEPELQYAVKTCWASAFCDRVVAYRRRAGLSQGGVAMGVVIQRLVDATVSGVTFTRHPTDERPLMLFEACRGLGEALVSGSVDPDRFEVSREGAQVARLASSAGTALGDERLLGMRDLFLALEQGFGFPLDLEWSWQGDSLFVLQARPITTTASGPAQPALSDAHALSGAAASPGVANGAARIILDPDEDDLEPGEVLVTTFTDPAFMRHFELAIALVMEHGGMLSHGAIVARECGIPAVIGVPAATSRIATGSEIRVDGDVGVVTPLSPHVDRSLGYSARAMSSDLTRLQSLRLKGRARNAQLAGAWGLGEDEVLGELERLSAAGLVEEKKGFYGLTPAGEQQRAADLASERAQLDDAEIAGLYEAFLAIDGDFKQLVTDVQLGTLERDAAPAALGTLHERFAPLATRIGAAIPRLVPYAARFEAALAALGDGDTRYLASPMLDSYHTLWFELHEELIQATGRSRADEAAAGRG